jgi:RNA polymerase sigma-70 factor (ECF subfamily)
MTINPSLLLKREIDRDELAALIRDAKHDDDTAMSRLSAYVYAHIYAFMYYRVSQPEDAEDLASEVVLKMVRALKHQRGNFHAWIYRIARNRLVDFYRKRAVRAEVSLSDVPQKEVTQSEDIMSQIMTRERLRKGLKQLTEEQRQVIILKFIQGYANQEIAEIVGKSVGAVKVLQFRALKALREYFRKQGYEK